MSDWEHKTLGDLERESGGTIQTGPFGSQLHMSDYSETGTPVVMPTNIRNLRIDPTGIARVSDEHVDRLARHKLRVGDIIYSRRGDVEKCALITEIEAGWLCGTGCLLVRVQGANLDARFLAYLLSRPDKRAWISQHAVGATMPNLNTGILREVPVEIPDFGTQQAIAATLGALDDKIESNRRVVDQSLAVARAHVDIVTGNRPTEPLASTIEVSMGAAFKGDKFAVPGVGRPLLRIRDLKTFESQIWTTEERKDETVISPGDVVVGMDAEFRATLWLGHVSVLNQRVCSFRGTAGVGRAFILASLEPELAFQESAKTGTTVIHLNKADIEMFRVPTLSVAEHAELAATTEPLIDLAVTRALEARALVMLRDALLVELFSGRLRAASEAPA